MKKRIRIRVRGDVQGVSFRYYTKQFCQEWDIKGWVQNKGDGSVEVIAQGEEEALWKLLDFCKHGPRWATVVNVREAWEEYTGSYGEFRIIY